MLGRPVSTRLMLVWRMRYRCMGARYEMEQLQARPLRNSLRYSVRLLRSMLSMRRLLLEAS